MDCVFVALEGTGQINAKFNKQCGVNGCTRLHNELLHRIMEEENTTSVPTPEEPPIQPSQPEPVVVSSHVLQATCNKFL